MLQKHTLDPSIFRAYDIRGIVDETLTEETVYLIGQALGSLVREQGGRQLVKIIGDEYLNSLIEEKIK